MTQRQNYSSGGAFEPIVGYSRSVRVGRQVFVSGCTGFGPDGKLVGKDDLYAQAKQVLANLENGLRLAGAELRHVVRTRIYLTDVDRWEEVGRAHGEAFGSIRPACTLVGVPRLIDPELTVEIEADAVVTE